MDTPRISFENTATAFAYKSDKALKKAEFLFRSMSHPLLVKVGAALTPWAMRLGLPIKGIIRKTIFNQFVGGETLEQTAAVAVTLAKYKVAVILDYGVEGGENDEKSFDHAMHEFIKVIHYAASQQNIPFISIKITGLCRFALLAKLDSSVADQNGSLMKRYAKAVEALTQDEQNEWHRVQRRMHLICETAAEKKIAVLVDAEETWIQDPVDVLAVLMMEKFNKTTVIVYNTIQLYRHDRMNFLRQSLEAAQLRNFLLGAKIVRGAYMEKERKRARQLGYSSPIQPDKEATDRDYNEAIRFCIDHIQKVSTIVATHNEESNLFATTLLSTNEIPFNHPHIHFSQLYGMSDHISFNLAKAGCSVSKYLPFGPIGDVVPYLMRRAQENSSVAGQTGRELSLIQKELQRRGL